MPDGRRTCTPTARDYRAYPLRFCAACAAAVMMASLVACSATRAPHEEQASAARAAPPVPGSEAAVRDSPDAALARALSPVLPGGNTRLAVAVLALDSVDQWIASYGQETTFDTASIIKVGIVAALLLQAQDEGRELAPAERRHAEAMIRTSDNEAAGVLWRAIGRAKGLDAATARLGLESTRGGPGVSWGLTQTTATDQVKLLRAVFARAPVVHARSPQGLSQESRAYVRRLMGQIDEEQDWGVSRVSTRDSWALKNGWLQRSTTGLWVINSVGQVTVHGRRYLLSVLSSGNASMEDGIELVERAAAAAIGAASAYVRPWPQ